MPKHKMENGSSWTYEYKKKPVWHYQTGILKLDKVKTD
jgi:hypothetical protein